MIRIAAVLILLVSTSTSSTFASDDPFGAVDQSFDPGARDATTPFLARGDWMPEIRLSENDAQESIHPQAVSDPDGMLHLVWKDNGHAYNEIVYRTGRENDWSEILTISHPDTNHNSPSIAIDHESNLHVVFLRWTGIPWGDYDLGYRMYDAASEQWGPELRLTYELAIGLSGRPTVVCDSQGTVYAFWLMEDPPERILYRVKDGGGWSETREATDSSDLPNGYYGAAVSSDNAVHLVYQDYRSGSPHLYHRILAGGEWSDAVPVTEGSSSYIHPRMAGDNAGNVHMTYGGGAYATRVHYRMWDPGSGAWSADMGFPSTWSLPRPFIAVDPVSGDVHITHDEYMSPHIQIIHIAYDASMGTWDSDQVTDALGERWNPEVCLDPDGVPHVCWYDERDGTGQEEIYYTAKLDLSDVPASEPVALKLRGAPNPFRRGGNIRISCSHPASELKILDASGRVMRVLPAPGGGSSSGTVGSSTWTVRWDGTNVQGRLCPAGVYFARVQGPAERAVLRVIHLR
ncbi:MAG: hypothetical protein GF355_11850 [Candidatus Eisenbacteria bacterium]|nr:hypothetical protein [Candidatus Eisenbacteria bacterium]